MERKGDRIVRCRERACVSSVLFFRIATRGINRFRLLGATNSPSGSARERNRRGKRNMKFKRQTEIFAEGM